MSVRTKFPLSVRFKRFEGKPSWMMDDDLKEMCGLSVIPKDVTLSKLSNTKIIRLCAELWKTLDGPLLASETQNEKMYLSDGVSVHPCGGMVDDRGEDVVQNWKCKCPLCKEIRKRIWNGRW